MEDEFRKDFEELLRLMDAGKLQDFKLLFCIFRYLILPLIW